MISNSTAWGKSISIISFSLIICCCSSFAKKKKPYLAEPSKRDTETILGIQIYLDENNLGSKIDGQMGQFTRKAVAHYNFSKGISYDNYYEVIQSSKANITEPFTTYTIEDKDFTYIGEVPWSLKSNQKLSICIIAQF